MGRVMDVAFFSHAKDCGMESAMKAFGESDNHCCDDESFTIPHECHPPPLLVKDFNTLYEVYLI